MTLSGHKKARMGGARLRIGVAFSTLAIVVFGAVGVLSARDARQQSEQDTKLALTQLAQRLAQRLDADMAARFRDIDQLANLQEQLDLDPDPARWRTLLERLQQSSRHHSWIGVADVDGRVLAATGGLLESANVKQRPWFSRGLRQTTVGDVHDAKLLASLLRSNTPGEPLRFVDVSAPLRLRGKTVGVIGAHLSWAWAEERRREALAGNAAHRGLEILLVNREGAIELGPRAPTLPEQPQVSLQALLRGAQRLVWSDGRSYLSAASASSPLSDYPGMGWVVVVRQPQELALAEAIALERRLIWLSVVGAALFGALGWFLADRLTRPLRRVAAQAQGMLPATDEAPPHDEVDQLARTLASLLADLKQREQDLTSLNEGLETRVQERTASLRRANDDLRAFSRSVSHDIQGPLGSMAQLLRQTVDKDGSALPPQASEVMQLVAQECERLKQLSAELLTLAMVEQSEIAVEPVDHGALARDVVAQLSMGASHAFPAIEIGNLPTLPGDAVMLRQVWSNLLSNAVKFTSKVPAPRIKVSAEARDGEVVFTVADNGAGFDEAQSDRLFGVFQRLHRASQFPGTGVGLSIVRRVVLRHGGRVWAQSPPGQGARFHFCLPTRFDNSGEHAPAGSADHHPPPKALTSATV